MSVVNVGMWSWNLVDVRALFTFVSSGTQCTVLCWLHAVTHTPTQTPYTLTKKFNISHNLYNLLWQAIKYLVSYLLFISLSVLGFVFFFPSSFSLRPKGSVAEFHVEVLKGFRVYTLVSCLHSCLLLNKGSFVQSPLECFLNMFQAVWAGN